MNIKELLEILWIGLKNVLVFLGVIALGIACFVIIGIIIHYYSTGQWIIATSILIPGLIFICFVAGIID